MTLWAANLEGAFKKLLDDNDITGAKLFKQVNTIKLGLLLTSHDYVYEDSICL